MNRRTIRLFENPTAAESWQRWEPYEIDASTLRFVDDARGSVSFTTVDGQYVTWVGSYKLDATAL